MSKFKSVGFAVGMPGSSNGFTTCAFYGVDVPVGTELFIENDESKEELEANAKLMAAAPDLLEALQKIISHSKGGCLCTMRESCGYCDGPLPEIRSIANLAIKKALGE